MKDFATTWVPVIALVISAAGLVFTAQSFQRAAAAEAISAAVSVRERLVDSARRFEKVRGNENAAEFEAHYMLFTMDAYINDAKKLDVDLLGGRLMAGLLKVIATSSCDDDRRRDTLIADLHLLDDYAALAGWAKERRLSMQCPPRQH